MLKRLRSDISANDTKARLNPKKEKEYREKTKMYREIKRCVETVQNLEKLYGEARN